MDSRDDENERIRQLTDQNRQQAELLHQQAVRIHQLELELERLKKLLAAKADSKAAKTPGFKENYSLRRNARRKPKPQGRQSTGRRPQEIKRKMVRSQDDVSHPNADPQQCVSCREQFAWRIIDGQAVYVGYRIHDWPDSKQWPLPPGRRTSRSESGIEIILILAFLHYWIGVSLDHACEVIRFFTQLELSKSQADSLLKQLAGDWDEQYATIAALIALQMIVYIDETGWKVGPKSCSTWVFSTTRPVLFRCGVSRAKSEAAAVLGESFAGIGVTDDYAAYKSLFTQHQLCWAHLIRKAIKLALQPPDHAEYAAFLDELCEIYHQALRYQRDGRLSVGRAAKAKLLLDRLRQLWTRPGEPIDADETPTPLADFIRFQNELMDNPNCLFVFVEPPAVEAPNNRSERNARREAEIRQGARTSKRAEGAQRRGVILTELGSLATRFERFTLDNLVSEVTRWWTPGLSLFEQELAKLPQTKLPPVLPAET